MYIAMLGTLLLVPLITKMDPCNDLTWFESAFDETLVTLVCFVCVMIQLNFLVTLEMASFIRNQETIEDKLRLRKAQMKLSKQSSLLMFIYLAVDTGFLAIVLYYE